MVNVEIFQGDVRSDSSYVTSKLFVADRQLVLMKRGNEETDYYAYLKLLVYCCVALFVCKCLCRSLYILMRRLL